MAGVVIALAAAVEEDMSPAAATAVTALMRPIVDAVRREHASAAPEPPRLVVVHPMVPLMPQRIAQLATVQRLTVGVADRMAVANIASLS